MDKGSNVVADDIWQDAAILVFRVQPIESFFGLPMNSFILLEMMALRLLKNDKCLRFCDLSITTLSLLLWIWQLENCGHCTNYPSDFISGHWYPRTPSLVIWA